MTPFLLMGLIALIVIGVILFFRMKFKSKSESNLAEKYAGHAWKSPLEARSKYPDVNAFSFMRPFFLFGLSAALAATLFAFSWTNKDEAVFIPDGALDYEEAVSYTHLTLPTKA